MMSKINIVKLIAIFFSLFANAQEVVQTPTRVENLKNIFSSAKELWWAIPVSNTEKINLLWKEKETSLSNKGIHTFVGYDDGGIKATLSFSDKSIYGSIFTETSEIQLGEANGLLTLIKDDTPIRCGVHSEKNTLLERKSSSNLRKEDAQPEEVHEIKNTNVLRVYRLAVMVDYSVFHGYHIQDSKEKVYAFWAELELFLNEVYVRDLGIKFKIVLNDALIRNSEAEEIFKERVPGKRYENTRFISLGTREINKIIDKNIYDLGVVLTASSNGGGLAYLRGAYKLDTKAAATANTPSKYVIAHEIGHLFGGRHTFSNSPVKVGYQTEQTELGRGFSVMSYGHPRNFFSLSSIERIREKLVDKPYYKDESRSFVIGSQDSGANIPLGIEINNQAPQINKSSIKTKYILPQNTFFQFHIDATDTDDDQLSYFAQQRDVVIDPRLSSKTRFVTLPGQKNNTIEYKTEYNNQGAMILPTIIKDKGLFTFWLGVNDSEKKSNETQITKYDLAQTKVEIKEGKPFKITSEDRKKYRAGEKVTLTWDVDEDIFKDTQVRILMSDDFGETYKYTLVSSTENDGSCQVTIPFITLGKKSRKGLIKIEVLNHIAFALTNYRPGEGGFEIENDGISLYDLPENDITVKRDNIPVAASVKAKTSCGHGHPTLELKEMTEENLITRTWVATDECENKATFTQKIHIEKSELPLKFSKTPLSSISVDCGKIPSADYSQFETLGCSTVSFSHKDTSPKAGVVERVYTAEGCNQRVTFTQTINIIDNEKPHFVGTLPSDISIREGDEIPSQATLTAEDNCSGVKVENTKEEIRGAEGKLEKVIYRWRAVDASNNTATYEQTIDITKIREDDLIVYNAVSIQPDSKNYFEIRNIERFKNISIDIFNEQGEKVFYSENYGKNGNFFRGISNVKGERNSKLNLGTFFYILKCQENNGESYMKKGFLFIY